jgi:Big-like domain-containing protein
VAKFDPRRSFLVLFAIAASASLALAQAPVISQVSKITTQQFQTITIQGQGFGTHKAYTGDTPYISLLDQTASPQWQAGYSPYNDTVTLIVHEWEDTKIVLGGFSGAWGTYNYTLAIGDTEQIEVWNPQTGSGPATVYTTVVAEPTTTTLTSSPNPSTDGEAVTFTAVVSSKAGSPPDGETVSFMEGKTVLATEALSAGSAVFITSKLKVGTTSITAAYGGDSNFGSSKSAPDKQVVN